MSKHPRDIQFEGFAREVVKEQLGLRWQTVYYRDPQMLEQYELIIARRVYDLVQHTIGYSLEYLDECGFEIPARMGKMILPSIPDLKEWPKESSK